MQEKKMKCQTWDWECDSVALFYDVKSMVVCTWMKSKFIQQAIRNANVVLDSFVFLFRFRRLWLVHIGSMRVIAQLTVRLQPTKHSQSHTLCTLRMSFTIVFIDSIYTNVSFKKCLFYFFFFYCSLDFCEILR